MLCRSALSEDQCNAPGIKHLDEKLCSCSVPKAIKRLLRGFWPFVAKVWHYQLVLEIIKHKLVEKHINE